MDPKENQDKLMSLKQVLYTVQNYLTKKDKSFFALVDDYALKISMHFVGFIANINPIERGFEIEISDGLNIKKSTIM